MLISPEYVRLNAEHHRTVPNYGSCGGNAANLVLVCQQLGTQDVLDYGCGKGNLAKQMPWSIKEYDPAIPGKDGHAEPADVVICRDVLEHVESDCLYAVLADLARCVKRIGLFSIATQRSWDVLADGRNAHVLQRPYDWWKKKLSDHFFVDSIQEVAQISYGVTGQILSGNSISYEKTMFIGGTMLYVAVTPKQKENGNG